MTHRVEISNHSKTEEFGLVIEPYGDEIQVPPEADFMLVSEGGDYYTCVEVYLERGLVIIWPNGLESNRLYRDGERGELVWDDSSEGRAMLWNLNHNLPAEG